MKKAKSDADDKPQLTAMMQQYLATKQENPDALLFYRLGDFYEMFFEDAVIASRILELTLTGRDCGLENRAPMCGVPYHAVKNYVAKLVENGYKVAICEQMGEPTKGKQPMERQVVQIITPGTIMETEALESSVNNFLMYIFTDGSNVGVCYSDVSTGLIELAEINGTDYIKQLDDILVRVKPKEVLCNEDTISMCANLSAVKNKYVPDFTIYEGCRQNLATAKKELCDFFEVSSLAKFDAADKKWGIIATARLLDYVKDTQKRQITNIKKLVCVKDENFVHLDISARRNLELTENMSLRRRYGSLLWLLDQTKTCMGARKIRSFIDKPLRNSKEINQRLEAVEELRSNYILRDSLQQSLINIQDIERRCSKISANTITPRELVSISGSLKKIAQLKNQISGCKSKLLLHLSEQMTDLSEVADKINSAIEPDPPANLKDGGYIAKGYSTELDELRNAKDYGTTWLASLEVAERERTGIKNLKTGYNRVFGYYIEVTTSGLPLVPDNYIRKQTTTNSERFITPELKEMEYKILNSNEEAIKLESVLYTQLKEYMQGYISNMLQSSDAIAILDVLVSFAAVASKHNYCKPLINDHITGIKIIGGRHPVVEAMQSGTNFVPNDCSLDDLNHTMLITGPNMAGKSTYMRQVAIITLMAHIGCFVPAQSAEICLVDRIFTRVGASDELAFGQSTFMVEMNEVANILSNATQKSLILLDEVGRGTSTFDGMSIAWAILEYIAQNIKCKTLFSTHYHELTSLEGKIDGVKNYKVMVKEFNGNVIFLHKISRGSANKSFGIEVAKLAGLPSSLLERAKQILQHQEATSGKTSVTPDGQVVQNISAAEREVLSIIKELDINSMPPIVAFTTLCDLNEKLKKN